MTAVLAVGAHPDDVELGCGATLAKHVSVGDDVFIIIMATQPGGADEDVRMERARAHAAEAGKDIGVRQVRMFDGRDQRLDLASRLDLTRLVEAVVTELRPGVVYTHHSDDRNLDHNITHDVVLTACRPLSGCSVRRLLTFEVPSSTEWGSGFEPTSYVVADKPCWSTKVKALLRYEGEMKLWSHPRSIAGITARATMRGLTVGADMAEAFMLIREVA